MATSVVSPPRQGRRHQPQSRRRLGAVLALAAALVGLASAGASAQGPDDGGGSGASDWAPTLPLPAGDDYPVVNLPLAPLSLPPVPGEHVYVLPASPQCTAAAAAACTAMVRRCTPVAGCEVQCRSPAPPALSAECIASHPCARDVEGLCADHQPGAILRCLHHHRDALSPACRAAEPCLQAPHWREECGAPHSHHHGHAPGGGVVGVRRFMHGLFPFAHTSWESGDCACLDTCDEHLYDAVCQPCDGVPGGGGAPHVPPARAGPGPVAFLGGRAVTGAPPPSPPPAPGAEDVARPAACVLNPACGLGRRWCRVGPACRAPFVHTAETRGCYGPYFDHPTCEATVIHRLATAAVAANGATNATAPGLDSVEARKALAAAHIAGALHRCEAQAAAAAEGVCPEPTAAELDAAHSYLDPGSYTRVRSCHVPPTLGSFVRHFFDGVTAMMHGDADAVDGGGGVDGSRGSNAGAPPTMGGDHRFGGGSGPRAPVFRGGRYIPVPQPQSAVAPAAAIPALLPPAPVMHGTPWHVRLPQAWRALVGDHGAHHGTVHGAGGHTSHWTTAAVSLGIVMLVAVGATMLWFCVRHRATLCRCARPAATRCCTATLAACVAGAHCATAPCRSGRGRRFPYPLSVIFGGGGEGGGGTGSGAARHGFRVPFHDVDAEGDGALDGSVDATGVDTTATATRRTAGHPGPGGRATGGGSKPTGTVGGTR